MFDLTDFNGIVNDVCEFTFIKGCIDSELKEAILILLEFFLKMAASSLFVDPKNRGGSVYLLPYIIIFIWNCIIFKLMEEVLFKIIKMA